MTYRYLHSDITSSCNSSHVEIFNWELSDVGKLLLNYYHGLLSFCNNKEKMFNFTAKMFIPSQ